jgi:peptidoglycan-associated lipoprotein
VPRLWKNKPLAVVLSAFIVLVASCAHHKAVEAPQPTGSGPAGAQPSTTPGAGTTVVTPEPKISAAENPESEVSTSALPTNLEELNKAGYVKDAFFDTDKSDLRPDARDVLAADASWLKDHPTVKVLIEGHCDERNTEEYNLALGWRRANNAKAYLVSLGVADSQIATISYGEERPFATCHNESCWSQNRRVHLVITAR